MEVDFNYSSVGTIAQDDADSSKDEASCAGEELFTVFEYEGEEVVIGISSETSPAEFLGACIDTGAQRPVIGKKQTVAYCEFTSIPFQLEAMTHPVFTSSGNDVTRALARFHYESLLTTTTSSVLKFKLLTSMCLYFSVWSFLRNMACRLMSRAICLCRKMRMGTTPHPQRWSSVLGMARRNLVHQYRTAKDAPSFLSPNVREAVCCPKARRSNQLYNAGYA